jgi:hypothetical protein
MFTSENTGEIAALQEEITSKRDLGEVILDIKQLTSTQTLEAENLIAVMDSFVTELGYNALGSRWQEINRQIAERILTFCLTKDLAYSSPMMTESEAQVIILNLFNLFPGELRFFTNLSNPESKSIMSAWNSLTDATFDTGVIIVSNEHKTPTLETRLGILWFKDED